MTIEQPETPEVKVSMPRVPRLGATASGLVALLLVSALYFLFPFGAVVAPLGLLPVFHFQSGEGSGVRAWGPVAALLVMAALLGVADLFLPLLLSYLLVIVLPSSSAEMWVRFGWNEGRWVLATTLAASIASLAVVTWIASPSTPIEAAEVWSDEAMTGVSELYLESGVPESEVDRILVAVEPVKTLIAMLMPIAPVAYVVMVLFWVRPRLQLLGLPVEVADFESFRNDDLLAALFALAGIGTLVFNGVGRWVAVNLLAVALILYFVQGLAMIRAHLARWFGRGWLVRWGVALLCLQGPLPLLVATLGIADSFRPLRPRVDDDGGTQ